MRTPFLIAGFLSIIGVTSLGVTDINEFYGFKLGISETEAINLLKKKGFEDYYDLDKKTANGHPKPFKEFLDQAEKRVAPFCMSRYSGPVRFMDCARPVPLKNPILAVSPEFYKEKLFRLVVFFNPDFGKESMQGVLGKFGFPQQEVEEVHFPPNNKAPGELCKVSPGCRTATWKTPTFALEILFKGKRYLDAQAVTLDLIDLSTYFAAGRSLEDGLKKDFEKKAKDLDF